jgi:hypothetical protein
VISAATGQTGRLLWGKWLTAEVEVEVDVEDNRCQLQGYALWLRGTEPVQFFHASSSSADYYY